MDPNPNPPSGLSSGTGAGSKVEAVYSVDEEMANADGRMSTQLNLNKRARYSVMKVDLLPDDEQGKLMWRGDPNDTYSDWTIEVVFDVPSSSTAAVAGAPAPAPEVAPSAVPVIPGTTTTQEGATVTQTYHVHRYFLGFGTRRSEYFAKLFRQSFQGDGQINSTTLHLDYIAAKAFPDLLDHLYDPRSQLAIDTETATALHHLGVTLEMSHLQHYTTQFVKQDLCLANLERYYEHAKTFGDTTVLALVVEFMAANMAHISTTSHFVLHQTDANVWKTALTKLSVPAHNFTTDLHVSKLLTQFAVAHRDTLDALTFETLTDPAKLRKVDPQVAWTLCELDDHFTSRRAESQAASAIPDAADIHTMQPLSSLQQRCATALAEDWQSLDAQSPQVKTRKPAFLVDLLDKSLTKAKQQVGNAGNNKPAYQPPPSTGSRKQPRRR